MSRHWGYAPELQCACKSTPTAAFLLASTLPSPRRRSSRTCPQARLGLPGKWGRHVQRATVEGVPADVTVTAEKIDVSYLVGTGVAVGIICGWFLRGFTRGAIIQQPTVQEDSEGVDNTGPSRSRGENSPVLDEMEFPEYVESVTITNLTMGESPALVRKIQRLPSRALSEIQYCFGARLVGDREGNVDLSVAVRIPLLGGLINVPVRVSSLDIDAKVWLGFTLVPYQPWVRMVQWGLVKLPTVKFKMRIANIIPVTAVPVLSNILNQILTKEIPKEFLFPKTQVIDLMQGQDTKVDFERRLREAKGLETQLSSDKNLRKRFPDLAQLFDSMDLDGDGVLSLEEVSTGLVEWGYASLADQRSINDLLDVDNDGAVDLQEFCSVWRDLENVFVPRRFHGVLSGVLLKAEGLLVPWGFSDPYIVLRVEDQMVRSKRNKSTSKKGKGSGTAVWNEGFEIFVENPRGASLQVLVCEGSMLAYYPQGLPAVPAKVSHSGSGGALAKERFPTSETVLGYGSVPISRLKGRPTQEMWLPLNVNGGKVLLDLLWSEFVDPRTT